MDVHRCRFVPYPASPVNALAFSHETSKNRAAPETLRLALGRANGDIEIWDPKNGVWVQELILRGGKGRSLEGLAWTHDLEEEGPNGEVLPGKLRLFSIGYSNAVTEWDFAAGMPLRSSSGNQSEVWCIAAQPRWNKQRDGQNTRRDQLLAVGCSDGSIVLHSTEDGGLNYLRTLQRPSNLKARVLSITFKGRDTVIAGCSDGTIWIYDIRGPGKVKRTMSLGAGPKGSSNSILVWTVKVVGKDKLVSGDSNGELRFWDLKTATQFQRVKCHDADVHDVASNVDGTSLLSAGTDRKMCRLQYDAASRRWHRVSHTKVHRHEVKVMAVLETKGLNLVVSGGSDSVPTVTPLGKFGSEYHRSLPSFPNIPPVVSAPNHRLLVSWWDREVHLCCVTADLLNHKSIRESGDVPLEDSVMDKILLQGEEAITSVDVSSDGCHLLVGTTVGCRMFKLRPRNQNSVKSSQSSTEGLKIRTLKVPKTLSSCGARHVKFSPDGKWLLIVKPNSTLLLYRIIKSQTLRAQTEILESPVELDRRKHSSSTISQPLDGTLGEYQSSVCRVAWSSDSRIIVCGDLSGNLDAWILQGDEKPLDHTSTAAKLSTNGHAKDARKDSSSSESSGSSDEDESILDDSKMVLGQFWSRSRSGLPNLSAFSLILSFYPPDLVTHEAKSGETQSHGSSLSTYDRHRPGKAVDKLVAVTALHDIYEFEVLGGRLSDWSRRNPPSHFPPEFLRDKERAMGCVWDTHNNKKRIWIYSSTALWMFDMSGDFPENVLAKGPRNQMTVPGDEDAHSSKGRKRKRDDDEERWQDPRGHTSGAGDKIRAPLMQHGFGGDVRTTNTDDVETTQTTDPMDLDQQGNLEGFSSEEDEGMESSANNRSETFSTLVQHRRANEVDGGMSLRPDINKNQSNGDLTHSNMTNGVSRGYVDGDDTGNIRHENGLDMEENTAVVDSDPMPAQRRSIHFWRTYQYRPILGIVSLGRVEDNITSGVDSDEAAPDLEVALVERPLWQTSLDLPWDSRP